MGLTKKKKLKQIEQQLSKIKSTFGGLQERIATEGITGAGGKVLLAPTKPQLSTPTTPTPAVTPTTPISPTQPVTPTPPTQQPSELQGLRDSLTYIQKRITESVAPTQEEIGLQKQLQNLIASRELGLQKAAEQPIATPFITGQQKAITTRAGIQALPLQAQLSTLQAQRKAAFDVSEAQLGFEEAKLSRAEEAAKPPKPFTLTPGQQRFEFNPATGQFEATAGVAPKEVAEKAPDTIGNAESGFYTWNSETKKYELAIPGTGKQLSVTDIAKAEEKKVSVEAAKSDALDAHSLVTDLLNSPGLESITGLIQGLPFIGPLPGTAGALAKNQFNQIIGILSLENRQKLKGQGTISDFEGKMLSEASSSLGRNLSEQDFRKQLLKIKGAFASASGIDADINVTSPSGDSFSTTASREEINQLLSEGNKVEYR